MTENISCTLIYDGCCLANLSNSDFTKSSSAKVYDLVFDVVLLGIILVSGITGNILSFMVLTKDRTKGSTNLILQFMAVYDTVFLTCSFFFQFMKTLSVWLLWIPYYNFNTYLTYFLYGTGMTIRMMRNWTVVLVSVERWIAICRPLHAAIYCTRSKTKCALIAILATSLVVSAPQYLAPYRVEETLSQCLGRTIAAVKIRPMFRKNKLLELSYRVIGYPLVTIIIPLLLLSVLNILLILGVRRANRERAAMAGWRSSAGDSECACVETSNQKKSNKRFLTSSNSANKRSSTHSSEVNRICLGVIAVYIICEFPAALYQVVYYLQYARAIAIIKPLSNLLVSLNSGINFYIYVFLGKRFRRQLVSFLCRRKVAQNVHSDAVHLNRNSMPLV